MRIALEKPMKHLMIAVAFLLAACGSTAESAAPSDNAPLTLRLGYFPNLTHAPALVGVQEGLFEENLPGNVTDRKSVV